MVLQRTRWSVNKLLHSPSGRGCVSPVLEPDAPTGARRTQTSPLYECLRADSCQASNSLKKENPLWKVVIQRVECSQAPRAKIIRSASFPRSRHWTFCWPRSSVVLIPDLGRRFSRGGPGTDKTPGPETSLKKTRLKTWLCVLNSHQDNIVHAYYDYYSDLQAFEVFVIELNESQPFSSEFWNLRN